jgi:hypothetical protein
MRLKILFSVRKLDNIKIYNFFSLLFQIIISKATEKFAN